MIVCVVRGDDRFTRYKTARIYVYVCVNTCQACIFYADIEEGRPEADTLVENWEDDMRRLSET